MQTFSQVLEELLRFVILLYAWHLPHGRIQSFFKAQKIMEGTLAGVAQTGIVDIPGTQGSDNGDVVSHGKGQGFHERRTFLRGQGTKAMDYASVWRLRKPDGQDDFGGIRPFKSARQAHDVFSPANGLQRFAKLCVSRAYSAQGSPNLLRVTLRQC